MIEYDKANDEMFKLFNDAWLNQAGAIAGTVPKIHWQGKVEPGKPDKTKFFCRVSTQNVSEEQTSLSACVEDFAASRFTSYGLVFIQIFCPMDNSKGFTIGKQLAKISRNAFRGKKTESGIWFRNVRINELENEELWYRFNVIAEYEYDDVG